MSKLSDDIKWAGLDSNADESEKAISHLIKAFQQSWVIMNFRNKRMIDYYRGKTQWPPSLEDCCNSTRDFTKLLTLLKVALHINGFTRQEAGKIIKGYIVEYKNA